MEGSPVSYRLEEKIAIITMDDGKANALSPGMIEALNEAFDRAENESKGVILAGRPGRFSAGFDLKVMMTGKDAAISMIVAGGKLFLRLYEFPKPIVMAVSGHAIAGGVLLAATGDWRIGARGEFKLGLNEVANGMPVPILAHELARDRLLTSELMPAVAHAKIYDPEDAARAGWLDQVEDGDKLAGAAMEVIGKLSALPSTAYVATKRSLRRQTIAHIRDTMDGNIAEMTANM
jgi:enoyl-CoA hydratase